MTEQPADLACSVNHMLDDTPIAVESLHGDVCAAAAAVSGDVSLLNFPAVGLGQPNTCAALAYSFLLLLSEV